MRIEQLLAKYLRVFHSLADMPQLAYYFLTYTETISQVVC